jgi:hypothetical protein
MKGIALRLVVALFKPELVFSLVNLALQMIESAIKSSSTDWDDKNLLPMVQKLRKAMEM